MVSPGVGQGIYDVGQSAADLGEADKYGKDPGHSGSLKSQEAIPVSCEERVW